ncbi:hypothetical protein R1flu_028400 [Riccia fluitans]|uniref:Uncharacterized protein n=1 Tax=Riccia fluitans TaxID=41844 RepID=A0ABD1XLK5_9MARC
MASGSGGGGRDRRRRGRSPELPEEGELMLETSILDSQYGRRKGMFGRVRQSTESYRVEASAYRIRQVPFVIAYCGGLQRLHFRNLGNVGGIVATNAMGGRSGYLGPEIVRTQGRKAIDAATKFAGKESKIFFATKWLPVRSIVAKILAARKDAHESGEIMILKQFCQWK